MNECGGKFLQHTTPRMVEVRLFRETLTSN